jgi:hypothetical protein
MVALACFFLEPFVARLHLCSPLRLDGRARLLLPGAVRRAPSPVLAARDASVIDVVPAGTNVTV